MLGGGYVGTAQQQQQFAGVGTAPYHVAAQSRSAARMCARRPTKAGPMRSSAAMTMLRSGGWREMAARASSASDLGPTSATTSVARAVAPPAPTSSRVRSSESQHLRVQG